MDLNLTFLFSQSSDFLCILDKNGIIAHTNISFRRVLGYTEAELLGKNINDFSHPADVKRRDELLNAVSIQKQIIDKESRIKAKNGRYYNINWSLMQNDADGLIYATGVNLTGNFNLPLPNTTIDNISHIIQSFNEGFFIINHNWQMITFNPAFQAMTGLTSEQLKNINFRELSSLGITDKVMLEFETAFNGIVSSKIQYFNKLSNRWLRLNIYPHGDEVTVFIRDITGIKIGQLILALEKHVLELNASTLYTLPKTIQELLKGIEEIYPDMICSVLEVDEAQEKLHHLAGPRLPAAYCDAINGLAVGPKGGSCGTAAYYRSQVIVSDIETDPLWEDYKHLAQPYGLKACWSTPIISANSARVLATFAVYYTAKRKPKPEELRMIERTSNILRVLIENKRNQDHVKDQNKRLQEIASISSHEIRRPVATILGLVNLFDRQNLDSPMNKDIINHIDITAKELDEVIHTIVEKTIYLRGEE